MATVPTNRMERELRKLYLQWLGGLSRHEDDVAGYLDKFEADSRKLIGKLGGQVASLGALADFPVPKTLELSPVAGVVYDSMRQAAISASITAGLNSADAARQMLNAGLGKGYKRLERLARTETVSAYWKNTWDSAADLPMIVFVWGSESSKRTCDYCLSRDGLVVEDSNIRDHPNGRCTLVAKLRSWVMANYKGTLQPDGSVYMDPKWTQKAAVTKDSSTPVTQEQLDPTNPKRNPAAPSVAQPVHRSAPKQAATPRSVWKPVMSRQEAEAWADGSVVKQDMLHGTSPTAAASIKRSGFNTDNEKYGRLHGNGVYVTENPATMRMYDHGASLTLKANVTNPVEMNDVWTNPRFGEIFDEMLHTDLPVPQATAEAITRYAQEAGFDSLIKRDRNGYIDELVVFDPKNLVVIK